jgi:hypothetical protein
MRHGLQDTAQARLLSARLLRIHGQVKAHETAKVHLAHTAQDVTVSYKIQIAKSVQLLPTAQLRYPRRSGIR